ncbi:MAG: mechanosensitive ion channel domain-containing protein [Halieaceae bacterium]
MIIKQFFILLGITTLLSFTPMATSADKPLSAEAISELMDTVDSRIGELQHLNTQIESAPEMDQNALLYRRDERSFELMVLIDQLAQSVVQLPEKDELRLEISRRMRADFLVAGDQVFERLNELDERIKSQFAALDSLSGSRRLAAESFVHTLESMRLKYFAAAVNLVLSREALNMPAEDVRTGLVNEMTSFGEALIGRVEFTGAASQEIAKRLKLDSSNAELQAGLTEMQLQHDLQAERLRQLVVSLERLGQDTRNYRAILLQHSSGVSIGIFDREVVLQIAQDSWRTTRESVVKSSPDIALKLLVFLLVLLVFRALSKLTRKAVGAALDRSNVDLSNLLKDILISASSGTVMIVGVLMALSQVGISLAPMLAGLGVAGFIVGFALQDTLGNFAAGAMILVYRPYDVDDFVEVTGASGLVKKMTLVSTTITTFDNQTLVVPNSKIWGDVIKNVTAQKLRRVDLEFGIGYGDDIPNAERVLNDIVTSHEMVLSKPEPIIKLHTLADSSVNFVVRPWVRTENYWDVYWDLTREVKVRFDREGISIPFPQRDVHVYNEVSTPSQSPS